jgi:hypothetical protein
LVTTPFSAVTEIRITVVSAVSVIADEAALLATVTPLMVTVALGSSVLGVTVTDDVAAVTEAK